MIVRFELGTSLHRKLGAITLFVQERSDTSTTAKTFREEIHIARIFPRGAVGYVIGYYFSCVQFQDFFTLFKNPVT